MVTTADDADGELLPIQLLARLQFSSLKRLAPAKQKKIQASEQELFLMFRIEKKKQPKTATD